MPVIQKGKRLGLAFVGPNATVKNRAVVAGNAQILGNAVIAQNATVSGRASVGGGALVEGTAIVTDDALIDGHVHVALGGELSGDALVQGSSTVITGPFTGGVWLESPLQVVVGRHIVGVDHNGDLVGLAPDPQVPAPVLTRWEAYVMAHLGRLLEDMAYKTPEDYQRAMGDEAAHVETHVDGPAHSAATDAPTQVQRTRDTVPLSHALRADSTERVERPRVRIVRGGR